MGVSNFDAVAANSLTVGGSAVTGGGLPTQTGNSGKLLTTDGTNASWLTVLVGKGTTPASGWTISGVHSFKDVTVTGAAAGDVVMVTLNAPPIVGSAPWVRSPVTGYVTGANTVRLYYIEDTSGSLAGATTVPGTVSYVVIRPS